MSCGLNIAICPGLSPLARGTRRVERVTNCWTTVYPRWRGEHITLWIPAPQSAGLSPLARGTQPGAMADTSSTRFIPAGAGNTRSRFLQIVSAPVYPRWRGEHNRRLICRESCFGLSPLARGTPTSLKNVRYNRGLSPLARGTLAIIKTRGENFRFIPAGAGNTRYQATPIIWTAVYPRWRGEHGSTGNKRLTAGGLSPLARGTPFRRY